MRAWRTPGIGRRSACRSGSTSSSKEMIAQMESDYQAARLLWMRSAWLKNVGTAQHARDRTRQVVRPPSRPNGRRATPCRFTAPTATRTSTPVGRFYRNCKGAVIYEGTREIHKIMQADYALGYRVDKPTRCQLPACREAVQA